MDHSSLYGLELALELVSAQFSQKLTAEAIWRPGEINVCEIYGNWGAREMITQQVNFQPSLWPHLTYAGQGPN